MSIKKSVQSVTVVGIASLLFLTGCATGSATSAETNAPSASSSAPGVPEVKETAAPIEIELTPEQTAGMTPEQIAAYKEEVTKFANMTPEEQAAYQEANNGPFSAPLVAEHETKAGSSIRVSGGGHQPGMTVNIFMAQLMPMPSYDAANDMYHQVGEQVHLTETVTAVVNDKGQFDIQLPVPATVAPQQVDIISQLSDGTANLVRSTVQ